MKKIVFMFFLLILEYQFTCAQSPNNDEPFKRRLEAKKQEIEVAKKQFITTRINLSAEQSDKFWGIYDIYIQEKIKLKRNIRRITRNNISVAASDEQLSKTIDEMIDLKQQEIDLEKKLKTDILKIINIRQLAELYRSEQDFIIGILSILKEKD